MSVTPSQFSCAQCGKRFAWKPALAGKRAKCACGNTLVVPSEDPSAHVETEKVEDEYDFAPPAAPAKPVTKVPVPAIVVSSSSSGAAVLSYGGGGRGADEKRPREADVFYHAPRDFYWPSGILAAGFIALLAWAMTAGASGAGLFIFTAYVTFATVVKTAVMIGAAFVIAPLAGVSFGTIWTAVLKLAAIVVMTDAALFWLQTMMEHTGAYPMSGAGRRSWMGVGMVNTLLAGTIIGILLKTFFDMDRDDVGRIAVPLAILNRVLNFIMLLIVVAIVSGPKAAVRPPAAPRPAPPSAIAAAPAPSSVAPPSVAQSVAESAAIAPSTPVELPLPPATPIPAAENAEIAAKDAQIDKLVRQNATVRKAREYIEQSPRDRRDGFALLQKFDLLAARNCYLQLGPGKHGIGATHLIVELPFEAADRASTIARLQAFVAAEHVQIDATKLRDHGDRYLVVPLPPEK